MNPNTNGTNAQKAITSLLGLCIARGLFFKVRFIKRTNGEVREMHCRAGVRKHLKGGDPAYDFGEKGLVPVWDLEKRGYRSIPLESILEVRACGLRLEVVEEPAKAA